MAGSLIGTGEAEAARVEGWSSDPVATTPVAGLHLQSGADASAEMVVSWHTLQAVRRPRVLLGRLDGKLEQTVEANETNYTDAKSGQVVYAYHAKLSHCSPTPLICMGRCTMAPSPSSERSGPRRGAGRRSHSRASVIRARRRSAGSSCHPRA